VSVLCPPTVSESGNARRYPVAIIAKQQRGSATIAVGTHGVGRWVRGFENDLRLDQTFLLLPLFQGSVSRTA
jgi:hypothetical protein